MAKYLVIQVEDDGTEVEHTAEGDSYNLTAEGGHTRVTFYRNARSQHEYNEKLDSFGLVGNWAVKKQED